MVKILLTGNKVPTLLGGMMVSVVFAPWRLEMKKFLILAAVLCALVMLVSAMSPCCADARDGGWRGHGGGHGWGHGHGWGWGVGWGSWWPAYYPYYPYDPYYPYYPYYQYDPYYEASPVIIQQQPAEAEPQEEQVYWYFCSSPKGYYPYVKRCPGGWLKVTATSSPQTDSSQPEYDGQSQPEEQIYWYCTKPQGYYPGVKKCKGDWLKVIPPPAQDGKRKTGKESYPDSPDKGR